MVDRFLKVISNNRVVVISIVLSVFPLVVWSAMSPFSQRWVDFSTVLKSLGQIAGIVGLVLFSFSLAISARFRFMERLLGSLNRIYIAHHLIGTIALLALLTHPIVLLIRAVIRNRPNVVELILPGLDNALTWGILSLWSMAALLVLTLYFRLHYSWWRQTHKFLGLSLFLAGLHSLFIHSDISDSVLLRGYLLGLTFGSLILFIAYTIFNCWTVRRFQYRLSKVTKLSDQMLVIDLEPIGSAISAQAGQFIFLSFKIDGQWSESHPFSLVSVAGAKTLTVAIKSLGDDTARFNKSLKVGMEARVEGPFGTFGRSMPQASRVICLAGGIGITPFISLLSSLPNNLPVDVYYCVNSEKEAVCLPRLQSLAASRGAMTRLVPWYSDQRGFLTSDTVATTSNMTAEDHIFLCGPPAMMRALHSGFTKAGLPQDHLHSEEFSLND